MTSFVYTWNSTFLSQPADIEDEALGAQRIRDTKAAVGERLIVDHSLDGDANDGKHFWATLRGQSTLGPFTLDTGDSRVFAGPVAGTNELFFQNSAGQVTQLTSGGVVNFVSKIVGELFYMATISGVAKALQCHGQAVSRTTYAALFAAIGSTYGSGDGSTTFNVPDAQGRVLAGYDNGQHRLNLIAGGGGPGSAGGDQNLVAHNHSVSNQAHSHGVSALGGAGTSSGGQTSLAGTPTTLTTDSGNLNLTIGTSGTGTQGNIQPTLVIGDVFIWAGV